VCHVEFHSLTQYLSHGSITMDSIPVDYWKGKFNNHSIWVYEWNASAMRIFDEQLSFDE
jgi:hypothetical protein